MGWSPGPAATNGNDVYTATAGTDVVDGLGGDDTLYANGGDTLTGGDGNDTLISSGYANSMRGGAGNDILFLSGNNLGLIDGGDGDDVIYASYLMIGSDVINGGAGQDYLGVNSFITLTGTLNSLEGIWFASAQMVMGVWSAFQQLGPSAHIIGGSDAGSRVMISQSSIMGAVNIDLSGWTFENWRDVSDPHIFNGINDFIIVSGSSANDTITGSVRSDRLFGDDGNDTIVGGSGSDVIGGQANDDVLDGGAGSDILSGGSGNNLMRGGVGDDEIDGSEGVDTARYSGLFADYGLVYLGDDTFRITDNRAGSPDGVDVLTGVEFGDFADGVVNLSSFAIIAATEGSDSIVGTGGDDVINALGGNDFVSGLAGSDTIDGGGGDDRLFGDEGDDTLIGGIGDDELLDSGGSGTMSGGDGRDELTKSGNGDVTLDGGAGDDFISISGTGVYTIVGGAGQDILGNTFGYNATLADGSSIAGVESVALFSGGFLLAPSFLNGLPTLYTSGGRLILTSAGTLDLSSVNMPASFTLPISPPRTVANGSLEFTGTGGDDGFIMPVNSGVVLTAFGGGGNDVLRGGAGNDRLFGGDGANIIDGRGGDDTIVLTGGSDVANGGDGNDTFEVRSPSLVSLDGGAGSDVLYLTPDFGLPVGLLSGTTFTGIETIAVVGGGGFVSISPGVLQGSATFLASGVTLVHSSAGVTDLTAMTIPSTFTFGGQFHSSGLGFNGSGGNDSFLLSAVSGARLIAHAGGGNDVLQAGAADDTLYGDAGNDTLIGNGGNDVLDGGAGADAMAGGAGNDTYVVENSGDSVTEAPGGGSDTIAISFASVSLTDYANIENLVFTGASGFVGLGDDGANSITGGAGNDYIYAYGGGDTAFGGGGVDVLLGGDGNDALNGGADQDYLFGDAGDDTLSGDGGVDVLLGGAGNDTMIGGDGGDYFYGGDGNDTGNGGAGNDIFVMTAGADTAYGDDGQDYFYMGDGDDIMFGGAGVDVMQGEAGNDTFDGGADVNYLLLGPGGAGDNDTVIMRPDSGVTVIYNFEAGGANDAIRLVGTALTSFAKVQAAITDFTAAGQFCVLTLDGDTNIWLIGIAPGQLTASDFVFA